MFAGLHNHGTNEMVISNNPEISNVITRKKTKNTHCNFSRSYFNSKRGYSEPNLTTKRFRITPFGVKITPWKIVCTCILSARENICSSTHLRINQIKHQSCLFLNTIRFLPLSGGVELANHNAFFRHVKWLLISSDVTSCICGQVSSRACFLERKASPR